MHAQPPALRNDSLTSTFGASNHRAGLRSFLWNARDRRQSQLQVTATAVGEATAGSHEQQRRESGPRWLDSPVGTILKLSASERLRRGQSNCTAAATQAPATASA